MSYPTLTEAAAAATFKGWYPVDYKAGEGLTCDEGRRVLALAADGRYCWKQREVTSE